MERKCLGNVLGNVLHLTKTPEGWERADAQISGRRKVIVYVSSENPAANAFVAYTPVRGDFTALGKIGACSRRSIFGPFGFLIVPFELLNGPA